MYDQVKTIEIMPITTPKYAPRYISPDRITNPRSLYPITGIIGPGQWTRSLNGQFEISTNWVNPCKAIVAMQGNALDLSGRESVLVHERAFVESIDAGFDVVNQIFSSPKDKPKFLLLTSEDYVDDHRSSHMEQWKRYSFTQYLAENQKHLNDKNTVIVPIHQNNKYFFLTVEKNGIVRLEIDFKKMDKETWEKIKLIPAWNDWFSAAQQAVTKYNNLTIPD
jgi:hypothetical protein